VQIHKRATNFMTPWSIFLPRTIHLISRKRRLVKGTSRVLVDCENAQMIFLLLSLLIIVKGSTSHRTSTMRPKWTTLLSFWNLQSLINQWRNFARWTKVRNQCLTCWRFSFEPVTCHWSNLLLKVCVHCCNVELVISMHPFESNVALWSFYPHRH
jgi:hypothetical protein